MRAARAALLLVAVGCGEPEQLMHVIGRVDTADFHDFNVPMQLESDEGVTADGCTTFSKVSAVEVRTSHDFSADVLRADIYGPLGTPRCFRFDWAGPQGSHSLMAFGPFDHDIRLTKWTIWPIEYPTAGMSLQADGVPYFTFKALPPGYVQSSSSDIDLLGAHHYADLVGPDGRLLWRSSQFLSLQDFGDEMQVQAKPQFYEDYDCTIHGGGYRIGRQFALDPLGRKVELRFEYRMLTNELPCFPKRDPTVPPPVPVSRGKPCDVASPCPFTDGDFTMLSPPPQTREVTIDLGADTHIGELVVRGLWVGSDIDELRVEIAVEAQPDVFVTVNLYETALSPQLLTFAHDGVNSDSRIDIEREFNHAGETARWVRFTARSNGTPVPIVSLAELSVWKVQ